MFQSTLSELQDHVGILGQPLARSASTSWNTSWKELAFGRHIRPGQIRGGTLPCLSQRGEGFLPEFDFALVLSYSSWGLKVMCTLPTPQGDNNVGAERQREACETKPTHHLGAPWGAILPRVGLWAPHTPWPNSGRNSPLPDGAHGTPYGAPNINFPLSINFNF